MNIASYPGRKSEAPPVSKARFGLGEVVKHRHFEFRGVVFDVDPVFANSDEWYESIPEAIRAARTSHSTTCSPKMQSRATSPMSASRTWSPTTAEEPVEHPGIAGMFDEFDGVKYPLKASRRH